MNKLIIIPLLCTFTAVSLFVSEYNGSTTAAVTLSGAVVSAQHASIDKKYKRKDCPVCKGKGWYMSGDDITKVPCGYCEPETEPTPSVAKGNLPLSPTRVFKR